MTDLRRQEGVFDSGRLRSASVGIVGAGPVANFLCAYLAGLGIGQVVLVDNRFRNRKSPLHFLSEMSAERGTLVSRIRNTAKRINPDMEFLSYFSVPKKLFLGSCDVIVDTTNDPKSKYLCLRYCEDSDSLFVSCSTDMLAGSVASYRHGSGRRVSLEDLMFDEFSGRGQGSFTSGLVAALAADEVRKQVCPVENDKPLEARISFSAAEERRFVPGRGRPGLQSRGLRQQLSAGFFRKKRALVVGAGGIGTYALINLAMLGMGVDIYDGDVVEDHNLNRQIIHFGGVRKNKAEEALSKMRLIRQNLSAGAYAEFLTEDALREIRKGGKRYDVVYSCVDSWSARRMLNDYCRVTRTPLFNGGVSTFGGYVEMFIPGRTHCLECSSDYRRRLQEETKTVSCAELPANVVMPNAIVGSLMVAESLQLFHDCIPGTGGRRIRYESNFSGNRKFFLEPPPKYCSDKRYYAHRCRCHRYLEVDEDGK